MTVLRLHTIDRKVFTVRDTTLAEFRSEHDATFTWALALAEGGGKALVNLRHVVVVYERDD